MTDPAATHLAMLRALWEAAADNESAPNPQPDFACAECERTVRTDWEVVMCACTDDPTCDPCCDTYHERASA